MVTQSSYRSVLLASCIAEKTDEQQNWRLHAAAPCVHLLIGAACAAVTLPFGLRAAVLAPVALGFAKGILNHHAGKDADPANLVWIIAGAALVVGVAKLAGLA
ncbi:hypothetical protein [Polaromonas sp.]|uniref:hypothetical protein n=1 Tax=Polaromonas sp. TaxID=1869339 RepID=UPI000A55645A|nr:hypothetical protein [Polaromonas sp.]NDP63109.1 hypothetical protein [Polaromonas sp.]